MFILINILLILLFQRPVVCYSSKNIFMIIIFYLRRYDDWTPYEQLRNKFDKRGHGRKDYFWNSWRRTDGHEGGVYDLNSCCSDHWKFLLITMNYFYRNQYFIFTIYNKMQNEFSFSKKKKKKTEKIIPELPHSGILIILLIIYLFIYII